MVPREREMLHGHALGNRKMGSRKRERGQRETGKIRDDDDT